MLNRQQLLRPASLQHFRIRGGQGHRLDNLSDSVFGLSIAILLLASSVPKDFDELLHFVYDALPLLLCMIFIYHIWHQHAVFFLRYGLYDTFIIRRNLMLLFLVLFYAYPLKFLMSWLLQFFYLLVKVLLGFKSAWQEIGILSQRISFLELPWLMAIYGAGFLGIFIIFYQLYRHVYEERERLELDILEVTQTEFSIQEIRIVVVVAALSVGIALIGIATDFYFASFFSGLIYNLLWIISIPISKKQQQQMQALLKEQEGFRWVVARVLYCMLSWASLTPGTTDKNHLYDLREAIV